MRFVLFAVALAAICSVGYLRADQEAGPTWGDIGWAPADPFQEGDDILPNAPVNLAAILEPLLEDPSDPEISDAKRQQYMEICELFCKRGSEWAAWYAPLPPGEVPPVSDSP